MEKLKGNLDYDLISINLNIVEYKSVPKLLLCQVYTSINLNIVEYKLHSAYSNINRNLVLI